MTSRIPERGSTHVYNVSKISKEEIDSMVERCVYEQPPFCNAACPLKLDTRALLKAAAAGNFKKALQLYEKIAPFPLILSQGCEAPCEANCRLCERGDGVAIRAVEAAAARFGEQSKLGGVFRSAKKQRAALFGSGLFVLFLAGELEKKMYPVTVFCAEPDEETYLRGAAPFLDEDAFRLELKRLKRKEIRFEFGCDLTAEFFRQKREEYQILGASESAAKIFFPEAECAPDVMLYEKENLIMGCGSGVMDAAFGAKKAALTADRLAQNLDPRNTRGREGAVESKLYTDLSQAEALTRVPIPPEGYSRDRRGAATRTGRCGGLHAGAGHRRGQALPPVPLRGMSENLRLSAPLRQAPRPARKGDLQQHADHHGRPSAQQAHELLRALRPVHGGMPQRHGHGARLPHGAGEHGRHGQDGPGAPRVRAAGHAVLQ